ncbi:MAG: hypothetical protein IPK97_18800 [Ahniella sp.]|nr:hypothetical protein [Ahniella sp.]
MKLGWSGFLQSLVALAFVALIGVFSHWPEYRRLPPESAVIKLSFSQHGQRLVDCAAKGPAELAVMTPEQRLHVTRCPRERSAIRVQLFVDGVLRVDTSARSAGWSQDGKASMYRRLVVPTGQQELTVLLSDDQRRDDFPYQARRTVTLQPAEVLVIDFDPDLGGIQFP